MHIFLNVLAKDLVGTDFADTTKGPIYNVRQENNRIIFTLGNRSCNVPLNEEICLLMEAPGKQPQKRVSKFNEGDHCHTKNRILCRDHECELLEDNDYV